MQTITELLINHGLKNRVLSESQVARVSGGSEQRRYGLVNRALKAGELMRLARGKYVLAARLRDHAAHPFALAQALVPGSYVSFETALVYHGWIPEAVHTTACVTPGRKSANFHTDHFGVFTFHPLAVHAEEFLRLVQRLQINGQTMLVAEPLRALMDLVCLRKVAWQGLDWLTDGLRIDEDVLASVTQKQVAALRAVYKQNRVLNFLAALGSALGHD